MDLYIFCVVLGAAGMAAMALLGFTSSHSGGHAHHTAGHELHGVGGHIHTTPAAHAPASTHVEYIGGKPHSVVHAPVAAGRGHITAPLDHAAWSWKQIAWSWLSPRVLFNFFVGFGATGLVVERLVGPV